MDRSRDHQGIPEAEKGRLCRLDIRSHEDVRKLSCIDIVSVILVFYVKHTVLHISVNKVKQASLYVLAPDRRRQLTKSSSCRIDHTGAQTAEMPRRAVNIGLKLPPLQCRLDTLL